MSNNIFRSVDFWKSSIMILPDNSFFDLLRTVFGKIKTPFNKQILLNDLEKFLSQTDIRENVASYISENDSRVIAAVAALNEPVPKYLETFLAGELSYAELNDIIVNLEERFIIYRFLDQDTGFAHAQKYNRLALNPVLESVLLPHIANTAMLFPSLSADEIPETETAAESVFDDRILAALLSFVSQNEVFFRYGGSIRRKVADTAKTLFPGLPLETIIGGLRILGLFSAKDDNLIPDYRRFSAFGSLDPQERMEYCTAGVLCYLDESARSAERDKKEEEVSPWLLRSKLRKHASFIRRFYNSLDPHRVYPLSTLKKLLYFIAHDDDTNIDIHLLLDAFEKTGLLFQPAQQHWRRRMPAPVQHAFQDDVFQDDVFQDDDSIIVMDSPFTFLVYPGIAYNDAISLAGAASVVEAGMAVRFELSRESTAQAFNRGVSAEEIIELLQQLSHNRIDENLIFTLNDWEKRHGEVTLHRGLVLTLSPEQRHLAETRSLERLITKTLAPGIYLLPETAEEKVAEVLKKTGITIIAEGNVLESDELSGGMARNFYPSLQDTFRSPPSENKEKCVDASQAATLIERFHSILKKERPEGDEHDELTARINRRLVLSESQLKGAVVRYEKLEARGLDYVGKALIAKQAVSMQSPVEVFWPGKQKQEHIFGIPKALEKTGSESVFVIAPVSEGETIRIPLGKISSLRRIKKSIFEG